MCEMYAQERVVFPACVGPVEQGGRGGGGGGGGGA